MMENGMVSMAIRVPCSTACLGEFVKRFDEPLGMLRRAPQFGADLDERRRESVRSLEKEVAHVVGMARLAAEGSTNARSVRPRHE
jgi:hypothetical protein